MATLPDSKLLLLPPPVHLVHNYKETLFNHNKEFVGYTNKLGKCVQVAYYGAVIQGPAFAELQTRVYDLRHDITRIFDKFTLTLNHFLTTAKEASVILQATFQFLLGGFEDLAIVMLHTLEDMSKEMSKIARELRFYFEEEEKKPMFLVENTKVQRIHEATCMIGALRFISLILMKASICWIDIEGYCSYLSDRYIINMVQVAHCKENRLKFWQSRGFANDATTYHAKWIALGNFCAELMPNIKNTREELYRYITENPTRDEALRQFQILKTQIR